MRKVIVSQGFYPDQLKRLRELSKKTAVPVNVIVERAVESYLVLAVEAERCNAELETPKILQEVGK